MSDEDPPFATDRETLERECKVELLKATGPGGQHRNKRETGVRLRHPPSGVVVSATERRSQIRNLDVAYARLIERLQERNHRPRKRRPTRVPAGAKRRRLDEKRRRSETKSRRRADGAEE
ncbi:MAG: peptide chain release factor-like protein [Gemmatimonadetes bacterium]|nr:peptide chain release factor-like protein [Gemmatimonadota bacterium]